MPKRVSHSLLDPWLTKPLKGLYRVLPISPRLPPEAIVCFGHLCAILGAVGFAFSTTRWWGGLLAACGVALNHTADVLDGTHARATNQCRNGGELLDHFVDPLSFAYFVGGLAFSCGSELGIWVGMAGIVVIYATAVLTNIRAKMIGEFTLARFGPTEFKSLLIVFGLMQAVAVRQQWGEGLYARQTALWFIALATVSGLVQLKLSLWGAIRDVNQEDAAAVDTTEWEIESSE